MPTTPGGIEYFEFARQPGESNIIRISGVASKSNNASATRLFKVAWSDSIAFVQETLGGITEGLVYTPPLTHPTIPKLVAIDAEIKGHDKGIDNAGILEYTWAEISVNYQLPEGGDPTDANVGYMTENLDLTAEFITMPTGSFSWVSGQSVFEEDGTSAGSIQAAEAANPIREPPGKIMPSAQYVLEVSAHPAPPWSTISARLGQINSTSFGPLEFIDGLTFAARHLLFAGISTSRKLVYNTLSQTDVPAWRLSYKFMYRGVPWDLFFKPEFPGVTDSVAGWSLLHDDDGKPVFRQGEFGDLI